MLEGEPHPVIAVPLELDDVIRAQRRGFHACVDSGLEVLSGRLHVDPFNFADDFLAGDGRHQAGRAIGPANLWCRLVQVGNRRIESFGLRRQGCIHFGEHGLSLLEAREERLAGLGQRVGFRRQRDRRFRDDRRRLDRNFRRLGLAFHTGAARQAKQANEGNPVDHCGLSLLKLVPGGEISRVPTMNVQA